MQPIPIIISIAVILLLILFFRPIKWPRHKLPFTKRPSLLTPAELRFYRVLLRAVPSGVIVLLKVRLMDVVSVPDDSWREYGAQGSGMHIDFVLADSDTLAVQLAIELDDKSHWATEARKRDAFKDSCWQQLGCLCCE